MDISMIQQLISSLGFPIVMVGYFIWDKYKTMNPLITALNDNTKAIAIMCAKLDIDVNSSEEKKGA